MSWMNADDALALLGTKPQTLYANVSRGRVQAKPDPADTRRSLYRREDIERLAARHQGRRKAETVAAQAIAWGDPVMPTSISTVADGRLFYRGQDAAALAETATLEQVAALLWDGEVAGFGSGADEGARGMAAAFGALGRAIAGDLPTLGRAPLVLRRDAAATVSTLAGALVGPGAAGEMLHERVARFWGRAEAADVIRRSLVLLAEHELNASTFAARVTASTGAALSAAVLSGLAALSGPLHGAASVEMCELVGLAERLGAEGAVRQYFSQGRALPCFGHRLYPQGDARAAALLRQMALTPVYAALAAAGEAASGEKPNIDFALSAMVAAHDLPADAPLTLFALGRSVGWLAHALEQVRDGTLIRPRAQYVGVAV